MRQINKTKHPGVHAPKHVNCTDTLGVSQPAPNHRAPRQYRCLPIAIWRGRCPGGYGRNLMAREAATEALHQDAGGLSLSYDPTAPCPSWHHRWRLHPGSPTRKRCKVVGKASRSVGCTIGSWSISGILSVIAPSTQSNFGMVAIRGWPTFVLSKPPIPAGPGVLVVSTVTVHHEHSTLAFRILNELNRVEVKRSVKTITTGAWCLEPQEKRFAHVSFWPAARVDSSMIPDLLSREEARLRWVYEILTVMAG